MAEMKTLRPFRNEDLDQVWTLHESAMLATGVPLAGPGPWEDDLRAINDVYVAPGGCFYVVEENHRLVAMGALRIHGSREAEIKRMRVDPSSQRQGVGQLVIDALIRHARHAQIHRIFLDAGEQLVAARRFYEKNGFVEYRREIWRGFPMIFYERKLPDRV